MWRRFILLAYYCPTPPSAATREPYKLTLIFSFWHSPADRDVKCAGRSVGNSGIFLFLTSLVVGVCVVEGFTHKKRKRKHLQTVYFFFFSPPHIFFYDDFLSRSCYDPAVPQLTLSLTSCLV